VNGKRHLITFMANQRNDFTPNLHKKHKSERALRKNTNINQLFISVIAPHGGVTANTMSRWIRISLKEFGVDTSVFNAHSTRGAAAAKPRHQAFRWMKS
jgi:hypothetical protein